MTLNNILAQTQGNIKIQAEMFFNICFNQIKVGVFKLVQQAYADEDTKVAAKGEEIIGFALDYFRGLLEDPNVWTSDMI